MKNIHILPTDKPSRLYKKINNELSFTHVKFEQKINGFNINQNIYITSYEEIKEGVNQWYLDKFLNKPRNSSGSHYGEKQNVIILTTDQDLIKDGVQQIDDEFLEFFIKNPSCEEVEIEKGYAFGTFYKIIIPKEEPKQHVELINDNIEEFDKSIQLFKQETLDEVAERIGNNFEDSTFKAGVIYGVIEGAKWQQSYSEKEVDSLFDTLKSNSIDNVVTITNVDLFISSWKQQFKKK